MYEELIRDLREEAEWAHCNEWETPIKLSDHLTQAADAIEELDTLLDGVSADNDALCETIERLKTFRWIPMTERLPSENNRYLTVSIEPWFGTTVVDTMRWSGVWMYDGRQTEAKVTHWMPLPEPPKEEMCTASTNTNA